MAVFQNASGGANNNFNAGTSGQTNEFFVPEIFSKKIQNFFRKSSVIEAIQSWHFFVVKKALFHLITELDQ